MRKVSVKKNPSLSQLHTASLFFKVNLVQMKCLKFILTNNQIWYLKCKVFFTYIYKIQKYIRVYKKLM